MPTDSIRILSIRQPFADEIIFGDKWNEIRSWQTPYRGPLYIHASRWAGSKSQGSSGNGATSAIIGRVNLVDCRSEDEMCAVEDHLVRGRKLAKSLKSLAEFLKPFPKVSWQNGIGEWNWILTEPVALVKPITIPGKLNVWKASFPADKLICAKPDPKRAREPKAANYVPCEHDPATGVVRGENPGGKVAGPLYKLLRKAKAAGMHLTPSLLNDLAVELNTRAENILNTLANIPEFERVSDRPKNEDWWRIAR